MRIAVPTEGKRGKDERVAEHFGRCETFTVFDDKGNFQEVIENTSQHQGGQGMPPELLKSHQIDILVCKGLGPNAIQLCEALGVEVYLADAEGAQQMVAAWAGKKAKKASRDDGCQDHHH